MKHRLQKRIALTATLRQLKVRPSLHLPPHSTPPSNPAVAFLSEGNIILQRLADSVFRLQVHKLSYFRVSSILSGQWGGIHPTCLSTASLSAPRCQHCQGICAHGINVSNFLIGLAPLNIYVPIISCHLYCSCGTTPQK